MLPVRAPHRGRVLKLQRPRLQHRQQLLNVFAQNGRRRLDLQRLRRIHHIVRRQPVMQPARLGTNLLRNRRGKGDHVVLYFRFDLLDALDVEIAALADRLRCFHRNKAVLGEDFTRDGLHLQPGAEFAFVGPDAAHGRAGITRDQGRGLRENSSFYPAKPARPAARCFTSGLLPYHIAPNPNDAADRPPGPSMCGTRPAGWRPECHPAYQRRRAAHRPG